MPSAARAILAHPTRLRIISPNQHDVATAILMSNYYLFVKGGPNALGNGTVETPMAYIGLTVFIHNHCPAALGRGSLQ